MKPRHTYGRNGYTVYLHSVSVVAIEKQLAAVKRECDALTARKVPMNGYTAQYWDQYDRLTAEREMG
jgi:hypothetical protein